MKQIATLLFMGIMLIPLTALADQEVCPSEGKVESVVDGDLDGIVLPAGVEVCIKAGTLVVFVVADGVQTLVELIGNGKNISHYTITCTVAARCGPTTTTVPPTTTTIPPTTTTVPETTTTVPETTTTQPETTTTIPETTTTIPGTTVPTTTPPELPDTGINVGDLVVMALVLLLSGSLLLLGFRGSYDLPRS